MKEFDGMLKDIFSGLIPFESKKKGTPGLSECHNLVPTREDYKLHELVIDMNATGYDWENTEVSPFSVWQDNQDDNWIDDQNDIFEDE